MPRTGFRALVAISFLVASIAAAPGQAPVRVAAWNIQALGTQNGSEWNQSVQVLQRMNADVVAIEEVTDPVEVALVPALATAAGYAQATVSDISGTLSGSLYLAVLSRHPIVFADSHSAAELSGDPGANDITRDIFEVHVQVPGASERLAIFVVHLKASSGGTNDFRRAVEIKRLRQAIAAFRLAFPAAPYMVMGDFNEDLGDGPFGSSFSGLPGSLPQTFSLGNDVTFPVIYDPFVQLAQEGLLIADATQEDSSTLFVTRASSGRRLDYIHYAGGALLVGDEVYNSARDNGIDDAPAGNWLAKAGAPLASGISAATSDHFPVFADFTLTATPQVLYAGSGDDFVMATGVNGSPTTGPMNDVKTLQGGDFLYVNYLSPGGSLVGAPPAIILEPFLAPGVPPFGPLPGMWFDLFGSALPLYDGVTPVGFAHGAVAPAPGNMHVFLVAPGFAGLSFMIQSVAISPLAGNGFLAFSDGHRLELVP